MLNKRRIMRLGVNIDHVATLRNARQGHFPDPIKAALIAADSGAFGITAHLREDRRHIRDKDMQRLRRELSCPLNMEMAPTDEMLRIACDLRPHACCLVPEKRQELTTEGGLDVVRHQKMLATIIETLQHHGIKVSLFIDPHEGAVKKSKELHADAIELHTGEYAQNPSSEEIARIACAASLGHKYGLDVHAGHGLTNNNVEAIAAIQEITELNIGHFLIAQSLFVGLPAAIAQMRHHIRVGIEKNYDERNL